MGTFKEWLKNESIETVKDFLTDPANHDKTFNQIIQDFEASGGKVSNGKYGFVFVHPAWKYVIKLFTDDNCYLQFARFVYAHPHPSFPKLYGPPQKIVPFYKREFPKYYTYVSRIEKLLPVEPNFAQEVYNQMGFGLSDEPIEKVYVDKYNKHIIQTYIDFIQKFPKVKTLYEGLKILFKQNIQCQFDESRSNIMQRANGDLVWSDPFWYGETPYSIELNRRREYDDYDYDYKEPNYIKGNEIFKKKRIRKKKIKPNYTIGNDEIPF